MNHSLKLVAGLSALALTAGCAGGDEAEAEASPEPAPTVTATETVEPDPDEVAQDEGAELTGDDVWLMVASGHVMDIHEWFTELRDSDCDGTSAVCPDLYAEGAGIMDEYGDWLAGPGAEQTPDFVHYNHLQDVNLTTMALEDLANGSPGTEAYVELSEQTASDVFDILTETSDWLD